MTIDYKILIGKNANEDEVRAIKEVIQHTFEEVDSIYNKWNPHSEISQLNDLKANQTVAISNELYALLSTVNLLYTLTEGRFDPTVEPMQQLWKKALRQNKLPSFEQQQALLPTLGWKKIHLENQLFWKEQDEVRLDLSGIAKGYLVDLLVERLNEMGFVDVLVEWGGEIRASGYHPEGREWTIYITHLGDPDPIHAIDVIPLNNSSMATSGDYEQCWNVNDIHYCHIYDIQAKRMLTRSPGKIISASVKASSCAIADAIATTMLFFEYSEGLDYAFRLSLLIPDLQYWLVAGE